MIECRPFAPELVEPLAAFARETWPARPSSRPFFDWLYREQPGLTGEVALAEGRVVAGVLAVRRPWIVRGERVDRLETFDWYTRPALRGSGLGVRLMQRMMRRDVPIVSVGGTQDTLTLLPRMKWAQVPAAQRLVLPLSAAAVRDVLPKVLSLPASALFGAVTSMTSRALRWFEPPGLVAERLDRGAVHHVAAAMAEARRHVDTWNLLDADVLAWLLAGDRHGMRCDATVWRRADRVVGLSFVHRFTERSHVRTAAIDVLRTVDEPDPLTRGAVLGAMLRRIITDAIGNGVALLRARSTDAVQLAVLRRHGFRRRGADPVMFSRAEDHSPGDRLDVCDLIADTALLPYARAPEHEDQVPRSAAHRG